MLFNFFNNLAVSFDLPVLDWIAENLGCGFLDFLMPVITLFGEGGVFWIACALAMLISRKYRREGLAMGLALLMGLIICNLTLKPLIERMRPYDFQRAYFGNVIPLLIDGLSDFSFPSGHTIACFEAATVLMCTRKKLGIPALILAFLVAFSRLYLYVHYPTDVLFSIVAGTLIGILACPLADWILARIAALKTKKGKAGAE